MQTETTYKYKIRNWSEYNKALIQRGSINVWVDEESLKKWYSSSHTCSAGRPATYSDEAILMLLMLREVFKLTLRSLQGFTKSLFEFMGLDLAVPSYTQISRRAQTLYKRIKCLLKGKKNCHIIFDSTGLKVYGEGEWKVKIHGKSKRRTWRKFHIGIDAETQDVLCCELTENNKGDAEVAEKMLDRMPGVNQQEEMALMMDSVFVRKSMKKEVPVLYRLQGMLLIKEFLMGGNEKGTPVLRQLKDLVVEKMEEGFGKFFQGIIKGR